MKNLDNYIQEKLIVNNTIQDNNCNTLDKLITKYNFKFSFERRGSIVTNNVSAWRVMCKQEVSMAKEFKYEIINSIGVISENNSWKKELNRISWNGNEPKYDLRDWSDNHEKMGKGITLTEEELRALKKIIDEEVKLLDEEIKQQ